MYYHIISSDLDGTLLSPKYHITEYTKNIIKTLVKKGIHFVIATGRHYIEAKKIRSTLDVLSFLITSNGARIYDPYNQLIYSCDLDKNIVLKLITMLSSEQDILIQLYSHDSWYINRNVFNRIKLYLSFGFNYKLFDIKCLQYQDISKIFFISTNIHKLLSLKKYIVRQFENMVNVCFSCSNCLEVMSCMVSKGNALKLVSDLLGSSLKNCLSFGDGMNDKEMLQMSGKGCIMKNGTAVLKHSLPNAEIIGSNSEDGVARYLNKFFLHY
ncbi:MAG: Cof-type HAD-IIB family hydrolase [Buchnera aphidicola (Kaburagia rhusicola rhusicola)]